MPDILPDAINPGANLTDAGHDFNYAIWPNTTHLTLCNVPWDSTYRDIVVFGSATDTPTQRRTAINNYIDNLEAPNTKISNVRYARVNEPIRIDMPINQVMRYNYIRAANPIQPITSQNGITDISLAYYYFIVGVNYVSANVTEIIVQLDVWTTFGPDIKISRAYVERGHIGIANENAFGVNNDFGLEYLSVAEGLDTGSDLVVANYFGRSFGDHSEFNVLIASAANLNADPWVDDNDPATPRSPNIVGSAGSTFQGVGSGLEFYYFKNGYEFVEWLEDMIEEPHVTQGILSITMIPPLSRYYMGFQGYAYYENLSNDYVMAMNKPANYKPRPTPAPTSPISTAPGATVKANWRDETLTHIPARYRHLKKLLTYPYCAIEVNTYNGVPVLLRPELLASPNFSLNEEVALMPPGQRIALIPGDYLAGMELDYAAYIQNFPTLAIANDGGVLALNARQPTIAYQRNSADWAREKVRLQTQNNTVQLGISNRLRTDQTDIGVEAAWQQTGLGAAGGLINGAQGGAAGVGQAALGSGIAALGTAISTGAQGRSTRVSNAAAAAASSENNALASRAAQGDYGMTIAGIEASIQETNAIPPSTIGSMGGELFNYINNYFRVRVTVRVMPASAMVKVGEFWLRYGYAVERFVSNIPANFKVMSKFTYWKLSETYLVNTYIPEIHKQTIRGIFEKGVTVWSHPDYIGTTDLADNTPIPGISY